MFALPFETLLKALPLVAVPAFGLLARIIIKLAYGARGVQRNDAGFRVCMFLSTLLIVIGTLAPVFIGASVLGCFLVIISGHALVEWRLARRDLQRQSVWALILNTQQTGRPLAASLRLQSERFTGFVGSSYRNLVAMLERGIALPTALGTNKSCVPRDAQAAIALASEQPLPTDPRLAGELPEAFQAQQSRLLNAAYYGGFLLLFAAFLLTGVVLFIVPQMEAIFSDFEIDLPDTTSMLIRSADFLSDSLLGILIFNVALLFVVSLPAAFILYLIDVPCFQPISDRLLWFRHRSRLLSLLAEAAEREIPFDEAWRRLASGSPSYACPLLRRRLRYAIKRHAAGQGWIKVLASARLIRRCDAAAIETGQTAGNLPWVLRQLADENLRQGFYACQRYEQIFAPIIICLFGLVVGFICIALFIPLVSLIETLV